MSENFSQPDAEINICLVDPAFMPRSFWLPAAYQIDRPGFTTYVPDLQRGDPNMTVDKAVDNIVATMGDAHNQYMVVLSNGIEPGTRYIDRLARQGKLHKMIGWTVISSVGPKGSETTDAAGNPWPRHTAQHTAEVITDMNGCEIIDPTVLYPRMLHDITDQKLHDTIRENMIPNRPLTQKEIDGVWWLVGNGLPLWWYIGNNDAVDNKILSEDVAKKRFGVKPKFKNWGHIGPITHPLEVADTIVSNAREAYARRQVA